MPPVIPTVQTRAKARTATLIYRAFEASDGWLVIAAGNDGQFARLAQALGRAEWANDARFRTNRTNPMVDRLIADEQMRRILTPLADDDLARALVSIHKMARQEGIRYDGWWGYDDEVVQFINERLGDAANASNA